MLFVNVGVWKYLYIHRRGATAIHDIGYVASFALPTSVKESVLLRRKWLVLNVWNMIASSYEDHDSWYHMANGSGHSVAVEDAKQLLSCSRPFPRSPMRCR